MAGRLRFYVGTFDPILERADETFVAKKKGIKMKSRICKQYSVFLENRVGALAELCKLISDRSINLLAICAIDTVEEAVLRIVAEDEARALAALEGAGFRVIKTDVLLIELENVPGATGRAANYLADAGINIDYLYASAHPEGKKAYLVLRSHQMEGALKTLEGRGE